VEELRRGCREMKTRRLIAVSLLDDLAMGKAFAGVEYR